MNSGKSLDAVGGNGHKFQPLRAVVGTKISPFGMSFCMPRLPELLCRAQSEQLCSMSENGGLSAR
jgi:hypothetical protein